MRRLWILQGGVGPEAEGILIPIISQFLIQLRWVCYISSIYCQLVDVLSCFALVDSGSSREH
jgi:hypothetical protein